MESLRNIIALLNPGTPGGGSVFFDSLAGPFIVLGVAFVLGVIILSVVFAMHRNSGGSSQSRLTHRLTKPKPRGLEEERNPEKKRKRHKRRRRDHRKRNPTLSETGGLPPLGSSDSADGSPTNGES
jgi:hypothetical protein